MVQKKFLPEMVKVQRKKTCLTAQQKQITHVPAIKMSSNRGWGRLGLEDAGRGRKERKPRILNCIDDCYKRKVSLPLLCFISSFFPLGREFPC